MTDQSEDHHGGCICGAVRYTLHGAPGWSAHCHCRSCQRATGAAFTTWAGLKKEKFEVTAGQVQICNTSPGVERGFCAKCGTSLTYAAEAGWPGEIAVLAPTLDDPGIAAPAAHVNVEDQLAWVKLDDGLPRREQF